MGVGVKHNGEYKLLTGNQSGSVLIEYILSQLSEKGLMPENPVMFNTVVTSRSRREDCQQVRRGMRKNIDRI